VAEKLESINEQLNKITEADKEMSKNLDKKIDDINNKLDEIHKMNEKSQTYSDIINSTEHLPSNSNLARQNNQKKPLTADVIIVKSKINSQPSSKTELEIKSLLRKHNVMIPVDFQPISRGGCVIKIQKNEKVIELFEQLNKLASENYEFKVPSKKYPRIKISNVRQKYDTAEQIKSEMCILNSFINEDDNISLVRRSEFNNKFSYVLELNPKTFLKVIDHEHINLDYNSFKVKEHIYILRCLKC